jgi:uncharacterized protein YegP (UPF0339 family)
MPTSFEIKRAKNKQFYFNLKAANGEIILTSEMYKSRSGAKNGIESVRKNGPDCLMYDMKMDKRRQYYFVLKAANHQVIGMSESYKKIVSMERGIESVMKNARSAAIRDLA